MSLVEDLQREIINKDVPLSQVLLTAKLVASKLNKEEIVDVLNREINGYPDEEQVPDYRIADSQLEAYNPFHGWQPAYLYDDNTPQEQKEQFEEVMRRRVKIGISQLEQFTDNKTSMGDIPTPAGQHSLMQAFGTETKFRFMYPPHTAEKIISSVKNSILDWSIELEKSGVTGEGLSFNNTEQQAAQHVEFHIENSHGPVGEFQGDNTINLPKDEH